MPSSDCRQCCRGIRSIWPRVGPDLAWNTAASFTTNTNWQFYTPESTMSYLTEMAGLATHNFFSAAVGIVVAVALIRGIKRTNSAHHRQFLGRYDAHAPVCACCQRALIYALLLVAQGVPQNLHAYTVAHTAGEGRRRPSGRGRLLRRKPSRCWAPTAADSSTPTALIRTRIPRRFRTFCRCSPSSSFPRASHTRWAA